jgi:hypothetical protein
MARKASERKRRVSQNLSDRSTSSPANAELGMVPMGPPPPPPTNPDLGMVPVAPLPVQASIWIGFHYAEFRIWATDQPVTVVVGVPSPNNTLTYQLGAYRSVDVVGYNIKVFSSNVQPSYL